MKLNDGWELLAGEMRLSCRVPCSVYETLYQAGKIPDPYWGENESVLTQVSDGDYSFEKRFDAAQLHGDRYVLTLEGVDTLADIMLNGALLGKTDNMHRTWEYDVTGILQRQDNLLRLDFHSPTRYIAAMQEKRPLWGVESTMAGYPHLRKAHYMFGWDWGPKLPDMGIWRDVTLRAYRGGRLLDAYWAQRHEKDRVILTCRAHAETWADGVRAVCTVTDPNGHVMSAPLENGCAQLVIDHPQLWWVRTLGSQPLYTCRVSLEKDGETLDALERKIGLRTLTVSQQQDAWGKEFCFINNGVRVFAMGANYIPEDQLLPRCTKEKTVRLLEDCKKAHYNFIRVWGGGIYPGDDFYDWCDENGFIVWQDFMFACSAYRLTPVFEETVRREIRDNVTRLRNHASLGLWCGNNEIESAWEYWGIPEDPEAKADYLTLFEEIIPGLLAQLDPETFYWPSSPSSGGGFRDASSNQAGDMHYWAVWHSFKPIEAFREFYYRFCSEYGFESLPDVKTIRSFAGNGPLDLCSTVMEAHQKCTQGNEKVMFYLAQMVNYPCDFERLVYCSQLVQADCIRSNVEHMRRARGRCMGSAYWQVNDSNPVISWSSRDYFGRWKGLHYAARRFYAPILLSCDDSDPIHPVLHVTNETPAARRLTLVCRLRDHTAAVIKEIRETAEAPALASRACRTLDLSRDLATEQDRRTKYLEYALLDGDTAVSAGTTLFVRPKAFSFLPARVQLRAADAGDHFNLTLTADCFAKSVCLEWPEGDAVFSDNWFDVHGGQPVTVTLDKTGDAAGVTAETLEKQLRVRCY